MTERRMKVSDSLAYTLGHAPPPDKVNPTARRWDHALGKYVDDPEPAPAAPAAPAAEPLKPTVDELVAVTERLEQNFIALTESARKAMQLIDTLREERNLLREENAGLAVRLAAAERQEALLRAQLSTQP